MSDSKEGRLQELVNSQSSRRAFAQRLGTLGVFAAVGAAVGGATGRPAEAAGLTDVDILNFALNLEYLEAEFYTVATTGRRIDELGLGISGRGAAGGTAGGGQVAFDEPFGTIVRTVADDEQKHVAFLRAALRSAAVAKPAINLEALGIGFRNQTEFIILARAFEDVGVSAYGGAAPLIANSKILGAAAQIALTEAQHASYIRDVARRHGLVLPPLDKIDVPPSDAKPFALDANGLSLVRTPSQVLSIVYASTVAGTDRGGFYPNGVNGAVASV
jgi:hypothetical protein